MKDIPRGYRELKRGEIVQKGDILQFADGSNDTPVGSAAVGRAVVGESVGWQCANNTWRCIRKINNNIIITMSGSPAIQKVVAKLLEPVPKKATILTRGYPRGTAARIENGVYMGLSGNDGGGFYKGQGYKHYDFIDADTQMGLLVERIGQLTVAGPTILQLNDKTIARIERGFAVITSGLESIIVTAAEVRRVLDSKTLVPPRTSYFKLESTEEFEVAVKLLKALDCAVPDRSEPSTFGSSTTLPNFPVEIGVYPRVEGPVKADVNIFLGLGWDGKPLSALPGFLVSLLHYRRLAKAIILGSYVVSVTDDIISVGCQQFERKTVEKLYEQLVTNNKTV